MIRLPQRSVTRFFIPLLDVLTLLFCIFLLMPMYKSSDPEIEKKLDAAEARLRNLTLELKDKQKKLDALPKEAGKVLQERLAIRLLEIDPSNGHLFYRDTDKPEPIEVRDEQAAHDLIEKDRRKWGERKQLYYLILYPRDRKSKFPDVEQEDQYNRWFDRVALGYDTGGR